MSRVQRLLLRLLAMLVLLAGSAGARADTPIALWKAFDGRVNFTGTQVSLRTKSNANDACAVSSSNANRTATLSLPLGATVLSAQLYWAGSGTSDSTVSFEGRSVTAARKFTSTTVGNGFNYFGGAADVTGIVKLKGSGSYKFSGLTVSTGNPWCASQAVLGGFSLLVVYAHPNEPERVLNLYEGFRYLQNSELIVSASNFRWNRTDIPVRERARIGHITWEGDPTLAQDGERLLFEGNEVSDSLNPEGNQFNSRSNINNDSASYGIDFDAYDTSVVIWSGYDARVTTSYRTGQDLVLLNAEILVVPTMPLSDLSVAIARPGTLQVGRNAVYTVTVTNNGPYTDAGPVTVTQTLPAGMTYVSGSGSNWLCTVNGQVATCTYRAALAPDTNAAPLTITAAVKTTGEKTTTLTVKGTDDDNPANNTAANTGTAAAAAVTPTPPAPSVASYVFTDSKCTAGIAIGAAGQSCKAYGAATVGGRATEIWLTAVGGGVPAAPSKTAETTVSMQFSLDCVNPASGSVGASYGSGSPVTVLPVCAAAGLPATWSGTAAIKFPANEVSVKQTFVYKDVGRVKLSLKEGTNVQSTEEFVVAPLQLGFRSVKSGTVDNPKATKGAGTGFVAAGAPLTIEIGALLEGGLDYAPGFGNEDERPGLKLVRTRNAGVDIVSAGELTQNGAPDWAAAKSVATLKAAWSEVGAINLEAWLVDAADPDAADKANLYLGVKTPGGAVPVGRFYPAYFKTIVTGPFDCPKVLPTGLACPSEEKGGVYSQQPFSISVEAYNINNEQVNNFTGEWFREVALSAVNGLGGTPTATKLASASGAAAVSVTGTTKVVDPVSAAVSYQMLARASYKLTTAYNNLDPRAAVSNPRAVFVRAIAADSNAAGPVEITTLRGTEASAEVAEEGGVMVVNGRLKVADALGTDILITPLGLRAEYYAGAVAGWVRNPGYADTADGAKTRVVSCTTVFSDGKPCTDLIGPYAPQTVALAKGVGVLRLRAPGKRAQGVARSGSVNVEFDGWLPWLPSTTGRISFGSHVNPVIYVRELYF